MKPVRPVSILVMGILNIIFGTIGTLMGLCLSVMTVFALIALPAPSDNPSPLDILGSAARMQHELQKVGGPLLGVFSVLQTILSLLFSVVLLVSGIGLVSSTPKPSARWACIVYGIYATLATLCGTTVAIVVVNPTVARVQAEQFRRTNPQMANNPMIGNAVFANISSLIWAVACLAYAFALLIVMFLPSTAAYFAGRRGPEEDDPDDRTERRRE
jgi:hypothetical protein